MDSPKYIEYDGLMFCRDDKTGYYLNSTIHKRLHRYVWEKEVGTIPKGCQIHHINGNKADNRIDNLSIMTAAGHQRLHGQEQSRKERARKNMEENVRPAAIKWHKSEEGRKWHSEIATGREKPRYEKPCDACGKLFMGTKLQRFCSNACKSKYRRDAGNDDIVKTCPVCGKTFTTNRYRPAMRCSRECFDKSHVGWHERWLAKQ